MSVEPILHSFSYSLGYLREQVADVGDDQMTVQPAGVPNHPSWTIGHLVFIAQAIGGVAGLKAWLDDGWMKLFGPGSAPISDVAVYPSKDEMLAALNEAEERLRKAVGQLDDNALDNPFPDPAYADVFPSARHAFTQVLVAHTGFHVGQIAVWRRAMGLPPMPRSFE